VRLHILEDLLLPVSEHGPNICLVSRFRKLKTTEEPKLRIFCHEKA
jgi:hypothetical protein